MSKKQVALAHIASELAYVSQKVDPQRKHHSSTLINKAKDEIHKQYSHLGLDKYNVENSNRDCFTMRNFEQKIIYIGIAGTRLDGSLKTAARDLLNDVSIFFTRFTFSKRTNTINNYIQNVAKNYPDYQIIVGAHSLGANTAESGTHYVNSKGYKNVRAVSFNAGDSPFAYFPKTQLQSLIVQKKLNVNNNPNITRYQHASDMIGVMNVMKPNCQILRTEHKGLQAHSLERFNYLRDKTEYYQDQLNNSGNATQNLMIKYGKDKKCYQLSRKTMFSNDI